MATQGFQLSQFERAPSIPSNIGVVDTKGIYGAVVDALRTNEALRTTQLAQAKTDAELGLARDKARTEQSLLEPEAATRRARANLLASESAFAMPGVEGAARARRAQDALASMRDELAVGNLPLASQVDQATLNQRLLQAQAVTPEMVDAQARAGLMGNRLAAATAQQGLGLLDDRTQLERLDLERKMAEARVLNDPVLIRQMAQAKAYSGMPAAVSTYRFAQQILSDPNSTPEQRRAAEIMIKTAATANADPTLAGQRAYESRTGDVMARLSTSFPKLESGLQQFEGKTDNFNRLIDEAAALVSPYSTGFGSLLSNINATEALELATKIESINATLGLDALVELKASGATLGAVTEYENKRLSSTVENLNPAITPAAFLQQLENLREARARSLKNMQDALQRDREALLRYQQRTGAGVPAGKTFQYGDFEVEILPSGR